MSRIVIDNIEAGYGSVRVLHGVSVDEPSVGLAPILVSRMIAKIKELKDQENLTVLMAEQNFNQAIKIADRGYIIVHGEIALAAASAKEMAENEMLKQYYLGA